MFLKKPQIIFSLKKSKTVRWFYYNVSLIHSQCNILRHFQFTACEIDKVIRSQLLYSSYFSLSIRFHCMGWTSVHVRNWLKYLSHALAKQHRNSFLYTSYFFPVTHYLLKLSHRFCFFRDL